MFVDVEITIRALMLADLGVKVSSGFNDIAGLTAYTCKFVNRPGNAAHSGYQIRQTKLVGSRG